MVYMDSGRDYDDAAEEFRIATPEERLTRVRVALEAQAQNAFLPIHRAVLVNAKPEEIEEAERVLAQQKAQSSKVSTTLSGIGLED